MREIRLSGLEGGAEKSAPTPILVNCHCMRQQKLAGWRDEEAKMKKFSHLDAEGKAQMVGVGQKIVQYRRAVATGKLLCQAATIRLLKAAALPKGDVLGVARIAGIQAVKRAADLIPLCHPLPLHKIQVEFTVRAREIFIECTVETEARTGVEMEALTGVSVAALTLYDMCKAVDKSMQIGEIKVVEKVKQALGQATC